MHKLFYTTQILYIRISVVYVETHTKRFLFFLHISCQNTFLRSSNKFNIINVGKCTISQFIECRGLILHDSLNNSISFVGKSKIDFFCSNSTSEILTDIIFLPIFFTITTKKYKKKTKSKLTIG